MEKNLPFEVSMLYSSPLKFSPNSKLFHRNFTVKLAPQLIEARISGFRGSKSPSVHVKEKSCVYVRPGFHVMIPFQGKILCPWLKKCPSQCPCCDTTPMNNFVSLTKKVSTQVPILWYHPKEKYCVHGSKSVRPGVHGIRQEIALLASGSEDKV